MSYVGRKNWRGQYHGHGIFTYANGAKYDGQWKGGKREGYGIYTYADSAKYDRDYKNGLQK